MRATLTALAGGIACGRARGPANGAALHATHAESGRPFSVRMSNCGPLGWVSDEGGYRYRPSHPETSRPWPPRRIDPARSIRIRLSSGEVLVLGSASRLAFHGVDRIYPGTSSLLPEGGRINLTLRRVKRSGPDLRTDEMPSA